MVFVFDIDDTLCDTDGYSEKYILEFIAKNNLNIKQNAKVVRFAEMKFDWTEEEALAWYKTYGDQMALEFPLKPNAKETVNALHDMGHTIVLATARATDWHVEPERITLEWLDKNGIKYDKIYLGRVDKEQICIDENADVFVDDDIKICTKVLVHTKTKAYLTKTDFNSTFEKPAGLETIENLAQLLEKEEECEM